MTAMMPGQYSYGPAQGQSLYGYGTSMGANGTGFQFRKRFERVDWRKIASVDVDRISRELDFHTLQDNIMNITFCDIQQEVDLRMVDPTFVKLFRLAQLTIEYLLHSQDYLTNIVGSHDEKLRKANEEHEKTKQEMGKLKEELQKVKQESRKRKKMLAAQQLIMQAGANNYHKCPHCNKAFLNSSFLQQHVYRRHPESLPPSDATLVQSRAATQKMEGELTEIKERLRLTESQLQDERNHRNLGIAQDMEKQQRLQDLSRKEMEAWKEVQEKKHQEQMEKMSNMFMKELKEVNEKYQASQNTLLELQKSGPRSNLGALRDDMDEEREMLRKQQEEVKQLKEDLNDKMAGIEANMKGDLKSQLDSQEDKWKNRMRKMQDKHTQELEKMNSLLSDTTSALQNEREGIANKSKKKDQQVEEMIRRAKEQERLIKQQRKQIDDLASRPPTVAPRSEGKPPVSPSPPKRGPSPQKVPVIREPSPETTEEESESEEEEEEESTMEDTMLSTNDLTGTTRSLRLVEALKRNPTLIQGIKNELEEELQVNLEKRGIRPGTTGITAQSLENKLKVLKTERIQIADQYKEFWDVRQQHLDFVDRRAKELQKSPKAGSSRPSSAQTTGSQQRGWSDQTPPPVRAAQKRPRPDSGAQRQGQGSKVRKEPPKPAPRTATPDRLDREHLSGTLTSTGSEEDFSLSSESEVSLPEIHDAGPRTPSPTPTPQPRQRTPSSPQPAPRGGAVAIPHAGDDETESNWDSESGSELEEISPSKVRTAAAKPRSPVSAVRQPQGTIVKELAQSIEAQLTGRKKDDKKPAGAVDAMSGEKARGQQNRRASRDSFEDEEDDSHDTFSLSSLSENPDGRNRSRPPTAGTSRHGHDSDSTNTLGTSVWGSSAGARAMKDQTTGRPSSVKSSLVSVTDWDDDDLDLSDL